MDNVLDSLNKQGRKLKQRLKGKNDKPDKTGAGTAESVDSPSSLLRPASHIAAGGHGGAGSGTNTNERQTRSRDRSPQPESVSVEEKGVVVDKEEANNGRLPQDSGEAERVHPSLSSPLAPPPTGESKSA